MDALTVFRTNWIKMSVNILKCMEKYQWTNWLIGYTNKWTILTCSAENSIENSLSHPNTLIYCLNFQRTKQKCDFGRCVGNTKSAFGLYVVNGCVHIIVLISELKRQYWRKWHTIGNRIHYNSYSVNHISFLNEHKQHSCRKHRRRQNIQCFDWKFSSTNKIVMQPHWCVQSARAVRRKWLTMNLTRIRYDIEWLWLPIYRICTA